MKKNRRLLCLLLSLCMVLSLMPMTALAAPDDAGVPFTITKGEIAATENQDYSWDSDTNVLTITASGLTVSNLDPSAQVNAAIGVDTSVTSLTLNGVNINGATGDVDYGAAIFAADFSPVGVTTNLTITLEGDNTVAFSGSEPLGCGIFVQGELTINGSGDLNATSNGASTSYGIYVLNGELAINTSGTITATGNDAGIYGYNGVTINGGTVKATGGSASTSYGIRGDFSNLSINGGNVTAIGGDAGSKSYGIYAGNVVITDSNVTATGGDAKDESYGIYSDASGITITGGSGTAKTNYTSSDDKHMAMNLAPKDSNSNPVPTNGAWNSTSASWPKTTTAYNIWIKDKQVTSDNAADVLDDGKVKYDHATSTLTLNGANISGNHTDGTSVNAAIYAEGPLTINLADGSTNTVANSKTTGTDVHGIYMASGDLTIDGKGKLEATGITSGICAKTGDITINSGTVIAKGARGDSASAGIVAYDKGITINGGEVSATGGGGDGTTNASIGHGLCADTITIKGGKVTAQGGEFANSSGIFAYESVTIENGEVTAIGGQASSNSSSGIASNGTISFNGGKVTAQGIKMGVVADSTITISGGTGTAEATNKKDKSCTAMNKEPVIGAGMAAAGKYTDQKMDWGPAYTVTYNKNEGAGTVTGDVPVDNTAYQKDDTVTVKDKGTLERDGFTFVGWRTTSAASGTLYTKGDQLTITDDITLYAQWVENPTIATQPVRVLALAGNTAKFTVTPSGVGPFSYQWQVSIDVGTTWNNVSDGAGETSKEYTTVATTLNMDNYRYRCIVTNTNNGGVATSDAATLTVKAPHSHDISVSCGNYDPFTFTEWDGTGAFPGGYVYLSKDVVLSEELTITGDAKLCLNGHTLSFKEENATIYVGGDDSSKTPGILHICDCDNDKNGAVIGYVNVRENGTLDFYGGTIQNPKEGGYGIFNQGKLTVFGGKVVGDTGVAAYQDDTGETVIEGGEIVGTKLEGLYAGAAVEISGGTIVGQGNGVYIGSDGRVAFANAPAITGGIKVSRALPDSADAAPIVTFIGEKSYTGANLKISLAKSAKTAGYLVQGNSDSIGKFSLAEDALTGTTLEAKTEGESLKLIDNPAYTVTYDGNGATGGTVPTDISSYTSGAEVTVLDKGELKKDDHTFVGWNTQANGSGADYAAGAKLTMGTANVTLYAKWAPIIDKYTTDQTVNAGEWPTFSVTPRGEGPFTYQWQVSTDDGSTWTDMSGKTNDSLNFQATEDMNGYQYRCIVTNTASGCVVASPVVSLTVNPAPITYTITFDSKGGSAVESQTVNAGGKVTAPAEPTKSGYTFDGWFKEESFTTVWDFDTDTVTADVTLYAKWIAIAHIHDWDEPTYAWGPDHTVCTATRICKTDSSHVETADAVVTSSQTKAPTCTEKGETTYTAAFDVDWAEQQAMTDEIPVTGHSFVNGECTECGAADPDYVPTEPTPTPGPSDTLNPTPTPAPTDKPNTEVPMTGDNSNMLLWGLLLLAAGAGIVGVVLYGKKRATK